MKILINARRMFIFTSVIEIGLSDLHVMMVTILRKTFKNVGPRKTHYRFLKHFSTINISSE